MIATRSGSAGGWGGPAAYLRVAGAGGGQPAEDAGRGSAPAALAERPVSRGQETERDVLAQRPGLPDYLLGVPTPACPVSSLNPGLASTQMIARICCAKPFPRRRRRPVPLAANRVPFHRGDAHPPINRGAL